MATFRPLIRVHAYETGRAEFLVRTVYRMLINIHRQAPFQLDEAVREAVVARTAAK
jgi:hypothetical protein